MQSYVNQGSGFSTKILKILDGIVYISYIPEVKLYSAIYNIDSKRIGYVKTIYDAYIEVFIILDIQLKIDEVLYVSLEQIAIEFNNNVLGSIVNPLGEHIMHFTVKENFYNQTVLPIFQDAFNINKRKKIKQQFLTGHNIIDILFPVGYGQRMMLVGDSKIYKTLTAIQTIVTVLSNRTCINRDKKTIFIYVSIGQTLVHLKTVVEYLIKNVVGNTLVISTLCNDLLGMQFLTPYSAMTVAQYYARQGYHIIVILDDLTRHAASYRELMLLARKPYGRDYYPSDIFYIHSSLLERSFFGELGSITTFVIVKTVDDELTSYITTNIISITDGQLVFDKNLLRQNITPAISNKTSVSRVGFSAQNRILNRVSTICKVALSNYYNNIDFYNMYKDNCDDKIKKFIYNGMYIINVLYKIYSNTTINFVKQALIVAVIENKVCYDDFDLCNINSNKFMKYIYDLIESVYNTVIAEKQVMALLEPNYDNLDFYNKIQSMLLEKHNMTHKTLKV